MSSLNYLALSVVLTTCGLAPGEGPKAERGYQRAAPVIEALQSYHADHGAYPDSLPQLVPDYLAADALALPEHEQERYPLEYRVEAGIYALTFRYVGPGVNECTFRPDGNGWKCSGYY